MKNCSLSRKISLNFPKGKTDDFYTFTLQKTSTRGKGNILVQYPMNAFLPTQSKGKVVFLNYAMNTFLIPSSRLLKLDICIFISRILINQCIHKCVLSPDKPMGLCVTELLSQICQALSIVNNIPVINLISGFLDLPFKKDYLILFI